VEEEKAILARRPTRGLGGLGTLTGVRRYIPALAVLGLGMTLHYAGFLMVGRTVEATFFVYMLALLVGAWYGYGPGLLMAVLISAGLPFLFRPGFSLSQVNFVALACYALIALVVSRTAAAQRQAESGLRDLNAELEAKVQQKTAELAQANSALGQQLAEVETLYGKLVFGVCFLDPALRFVRVNEKFASLSGVSTGACLRRSLQEVLPEALAKRLQPLAQRVLETGKPVLDHEMQGPAQPDGVERDWMIVCSPVLADDRGVVGVQIIIQDITERKQAAQAQRLLAAIVESSDDAIIGKTLEGVITFWNSGAQRMYGYTPDEVVGRSISVLVPPEQADELPAILARLRRGEIIDHYETVRRRKDGAQIDVAVTISPIRGDDDTILGASAVARDITDQKAADRRLRENERRYRNIFETAGVSIWEEDFSAVKTALDTLRRQGVTDFQQYFRDHPEFVQQAIGLVRIVDVNQATLRLYGASDKQELLGSLERIFVPETTEAFVAELLAITEGRSVFESETLGQTLRGERIHLLFTMVFPGSTEPYDSVLVTIFDITERKRVEHERASLLEREQAARAAAENASRLKDEFLATISHELRGPLQGFLGSIRLLRSGRLNAQQTGEALERAERTARAQAILIEDLLDISRIIAGKVVLDLQPTELEPVVHAALDVVRGSIAAKQITVEVDIEPTAGAVAADPMRVQQAIWNLLSNAVKFTPRGGRVGLQVQRSGAEVRIIVTDTGIGIQPEFLPQVFERFRQAEASTTRAYGGLGLGLAIVRHIVELHGGKVEAASAGSGRGSTFTITLPALTNEVFERRTTPLQQQPAKSLKDDLLDGVKVLVVDDQDDTREVLAVSLRSYGATVLTASSAVQAMEVLRQSRPDVLVSDIGMPGEDGFSLIARVRGLEAGKDIPAIALTGYAMVADRTRIAAAGFQRHLAKPIEPQTLVQAVADLVGR
jgi:PAS domain S-box-containing protein